MAAPAVDLRTYIDRNYPRLGETLPDGVVGALNVVWKIWYRIGYFRYVLAGILMATIPLIMESDALPGWIPLQGGFGTQVLFTTGYWILLTLGLGVVVGFAGLLDLGYVAFFMLGAYMVALLTDSGAPDQFHFAEWSPWLGLPFSVLIAMVAGVILGVPTLRLRGDYLAIVTLGFHEIVRQSALNLAFVNQSRGIPGIPHPSFPGIGDFGLSSEYYWWFLLIPSILLAVIMIRHLDNSRVGRYWAAIREDEVAAAAMGVPVTKMKVLAFVIGASTSGVAGWIFATKISFIAPDSFRLLLSILVLCSVVIGGLGSISGAVVGAVLVVTLPEIVRDASGGAEIFGFDIETGRIAVFGLLLIIVMIYRPGGLLAARRRRTELEEASGTSGIAIAEETDTTVKTRDADLHDASKEG